MLNALSEIREIIENSEFIELSREQVNKMHKEYNAYFNGMEIAYTDDCVAFSMNKNDFGKFEYYCGMEYEQDSVKYKLETEDDLLVIYDIHCERACEIVYRILDKKIGYYHGYSED